MAVKCRPEIPTPPMKMLAAKSPRPSDFAAAHDDSAAAEPRMPTNRESNTVGQSYSTGTGKLEGQHPGVVHRPGADPIRRGAADQPGEPARPRASNDPEMGLRE